MNKLRIIVLCTCLFMLIIGSTYAVWTIVSTQESNNDIMSSCFKVSYQEQNLISLQNTYPITDEEGKQLTPYEVTITNHCNNYTKYNVNIDILNGTDLDTKFVKIQMNNNPPILLSDLEEVEPTTANAIKSYYLATGYLEAEENSKKTYKIRIWLDEKVTLEDHVEGKKIQSKIVITNAYIEEKKDVLVTFDASGGVSPVENKTYSVGATYEDLPIPTKEGYTFLGWNGKNMFDEKTILMAIENAKYENGYYVFSSSKAQRKYPSNSNGVPLTFKENTQYTYSVKGHINRTEGSDNSLKFYFKYVDDDKTRYFDLRSAQEVLLKITSIQGKTIQKQYFSYNDAGIAYIKYIQVEEGDIATEYEPYILRFDTKVTQTQDHTLKAIWKET
ncbi:MAG: InlB B-repeat-containing protein [Bacilli bacterium]|nr:InlB B-repeat-containing protein [Bacilli bacterium]